MLPDGQAGKHLSGCEKTSPLNMQVYFSSCNKLHLFDVVSDSFIVFAHTLSNLQDWVICTGSHRSLAQTKSGLLTIKPEKLVLCQNAQLHVIFQVRNLTSPNPFPHCGKLGLPTHTLTPGPLRKVGTTVKGMPSRLPYHWAVVCLGNTQFYEHLGTCPL